MNKNKMDDLVSVIIPVYNTEKYIYETINSAITQTYSAIEIIIIDDGSTDNSVEIVRDLMCKDSRIKYYYQKNKGVSAARNNGIAMATGKYIAFLDSDDLWADTKIQKQIDKMKKADMKVCYCGFYNLREESGKKAVEKFNYSNGKIVKAIVSEETYGWIGTWIIEKQFIEHNELSFNESCSWGEDTEFFIKVCALTEATSVEENLALYRIRPKSLTTSKSDLKKTEEIEIWIRLMKWMEENKERLIDKDITSIKKYFLYYRIPNSIAKHIYNYLKSVKYKSILEDIKYIDEKLENPYVKNYCFENGMKSLGVKIKLMIIKIVMFKSKVGIDF